MAQDGSDIKYVDIADLDDSYLNKIVHLDFYNRSFNLSFYNKKAPSDKVMIDVIGEKIEFLEHRVDNGFNNWFAEQYIESTKFIDGFKIRITMCKILEITSEDIKVRLFLDYRDENSKTDYKKPRKIERRFPKRILAEVLVRM